MEVLLMSYLNYDYITSEDIEIYTRPKYNMISYGDGRLGLKNWDRLTSNKNENFILESASRVFAESYAINLFKEIVNYLNIDTKQELTCSCDVNGYLPRWMCNYNESIVKEEVRKIKEAVAVRKVVNGIYE
jgi:hypothetical protein